MRRLRFSCLGRKPQRARRLSLRGHRRFLRGAALAFCFGIAGQGALACEALTGGWGLEGRFAETTFSNARPGGGRHESWVPRGRQLIMHAGFAEETDEYGHGILGAIRDAKVLTIHLRLPGDDRITCPTGVMLPPGEVFEDIAPRLVDVDGDGLPEIIVVHSDVSQGARLAIYDRRANLLAATPHIGRAFRWLAPIGAADFDGDGYVELAYVDRPHLAKTLRVWRYRDKVLSEVTALRDLTNHRIGEEHISGGIRDCGEGPEIITADGGWQSVIATRLSGDTLTSRPIAPFESQNAFARALACN